MRRLFWLPCLFFASICALVQAEAPEPQDRPLELRDQYSITQGSIETGGKEIKYTATAGSYVLRDEKGKQKASIFFVAYTKDGVNDLSRRPVTFVTNGGPGSSAVWLHLGVFGPQRIQFDETQGLDQPPYNLVPNEYSLLGATDLVFIDPVSTGFSRAAPGEDPKQFHGVEEDVQVLSEFIRLYLTRNKRWTSPKFFAGESYGTTRAAAISNYLHDADHIYLNGVILISTVLNFQNLDFDKGNDNPYFLFLPSYTATAWYHKRLPEDLQKKNLPEVLKEVEAFAINDYALALLKGDRLSKQERDNTIKRLARYTGLSPSYIERSNLRVPMLRFAKELLRDQHRTVGRFDGRLKGIDSDAAGEQFEYDPSFEAIVGAFTAGINHYLTNDLGWKSDIKYQVLARVSPWNYGKATNSYLNVAEDLRDVMTRNPKLKVFAANGYYDLATPYFGANFTFDHLGLDPSLRRNIMVREYEGGHMMYTFPPSLKKLTQDLTAFIQEASK
jgi:carboxypeptidase C (cathepsin A)